jgi:hypothetical protein
MERADLHSHLRWRVSNEVCTLQAGQCVCSDADFYYCLSKRTL